MAMSTLLDSRRVLGPRPPRSRRLFRSKLHTQPLTHFRDGVINLGHAAGAHDERVLPALNGPELLIVASRFRPSRELDRLIHEQLVGAVEDCDRGKAARSASSRFTRGSCQSTPVPSSPADRKNSSNPRDSAMSTSALVSMESVARVRSHLGRYGQNRPG